MHRCGIVTTQYREKHFSKGAKGQVKMCRPRGLGWEMIYRQDECYDAHGEVLESPPTSWEKEHYLQTKKKPPKDGTKVVKRIGIDLEETD